MEPEQVVNLRDRIAALEQENAALWAFVAVWDAYDHFHEAWQEELIDVEFAREALYEYEDKP
jgi:hypothetical protein